MISPAERFTSGEVDRRQAQCGAQCVCITVAMPREGGLGKGTYSLGTRGKGESHVTQPVRAGVSRVCLKTMGGAQGPMYTTVATTKVHTRGGAHNPNPRVGGEGRGRP